MRRGRLAVIALLALLLLGAGALIATSERARERYWIWRLRSVSGKEATLARQRVLRAPGHLPETIRAEIVAAEVEERVAAIGTSAAVFVCRSRFEVGMTDTAFFACELESVLAGGSTAVQFTVEETFLDETWVLLCPDRMWTQPTRGLYVTRSPRGDGAPHVELRIPLDERSEPVLEAVRARLAGRTR